MLKKFYPKLSVDKIQDIDLDFLKKNNIMGLILDIDNTLVPQYMKEADENAVKWIERVKETGLKACIVSNASKKRVIIFNERVKLLAIHRASKPGTKAFKEAAQLMNINTEQAAVIGDQIFTDIYGGNKAGMYTVLVKPIDKREILIVRIKRLLEMFVLRSYKKAILIKSRK